MQGGLVEDRAGDDGGAVAVVGEAQPSNQAAHRACELPLDTDLVPSGPVMTAGRHLAHGAPSGDASAWISAALRTFWWLDRKVEADLMSDASAHVWIEVMMVPIATL